MDPKESKFAEKATIVFVALSCACATFALSVMVLVPIFGMLMLKLGLPELFQQVVILALLFFLPIVGAVWGIELGARVNEANHRQTHA